MKNRPSTRGRNLYHRRRTAVKTVNKKHRFLGRLSIGIGRGSVALDRHSREHTETGE
jgi:hypothetical protein